ncbi:hypothetical protein Taro_021725 [Colocasia esculenta]|uniref:Uncharacterized protein n=1 Tax=Colocasia esculenta TaxID=4460 RepID=A0A843VCC4_COLES|nr:hypothetical protein [Colocasia esculenta]
MSTDFARTTLPKMLVNSLQGKYNHGLDANTIVMIDRPLHVGTNLHVEKATTSNKNHRHLVIICNKGDNDMLFLMLLDSLHMGEPTRIKNELKKVLAEGHLGVKPRPLSWCQRPDMDANTNSGVQRSGRQLL